MAEAMEMDDEAWLANTPISEFREKFGFSGAHHRTKTEIDAILALSQQIDSLESCQNVLSVIGGMLKGSLKDVAIKFHCRGDRPLRNSPEGTISRPDIVAHNQNRLLVPQSELPVGASTRSNTQDDSTSTQCSTQSYTSEDDLTWTQTEATSGYLSAQDTDETGLSKAISYTVFHLLARPDRVVVPGFFFSPTVFNLIFTGATGTCHTLLKWDDPEHLQLLVEFVERIFKPSPEMLDPNIIRNTDDTFDISLKEEIYTKCKTLALGRAIGRRTTIFKTSDPEVPIIKEQYLTSPSVEYNILEQVINVPGVVRLKDYDEYRPEDESKGAAVGCTIAETARYKFRLTLKDEGVSIGDSRTLKQFLIRLYDTLEVAECLYLLGLLHRDYSLNNVLFREPTVREEWKGATFCSARHLLDPREDRLKTEVLLIDFELATNHATQRNLESAGTPMYQARAAEQIAPLGFAGIVPGMPKLIPEALECYRKVWPERLKQFPPDESYHILNPSKGDKRKWHQELRHDVESAFWILLHWVVIFRPSHDKEPIPSAFWALFTTEGWRNTLVMKVQGRDKSPWVPPALDPVRELVRDMAIHLDGDLQWLSKDDKCYEQMKQASYLREVFQRLILNFLFKYKNDPFMNLEKCRENGGIQKNTNESVNLSTQQVEERQLMRSLSRKRIREEDDQQGSTKRRKSNPTPDNGNDSDCNPGR